MESVMNAIRAVRNRRADLNVPPSRKSTLYVVTEKADIFNQGAAFITRLAYANEMIVSAEVPAGYEDMVSAITSDAAVYMPMNELVDIEKEKARLTKDLGKKQGELKGLEGKLSNPGFLAKAPEAVVAAEKDRAEKLKELIKKIEEQLSAMQ